eukprot:scaffold748_cov329-Pavlova_lutheri.AAC.10
MFTVMEVRRPRMESGALASTPRHWRAHVFQPCALDLLHLPRVRSDLAPDGLAPTHAERRQPDRQLRVFIGCVSGAVHFELDLSLLHRARVSAVVGVVVRHRADCDLLRLFLLLHPELEEQREAAAPGLMFGGSCLVFGCGEHDAAVVLGVSSFSDGPVLSIPWASNNMCLVARSPPILFSSIRSLGRMWMFNPGDETGPTVLLLLVMVVVVVVVAILVLPLASSLPPSSSTSATFVLLSYHSSLFTCPSFVPTRRGSPSLRLPSAFPRTWEGGGG